MTEVTPGEMTALERLVSERVGPGASLRNLTVLEHVVYADVDVPNVTGVLYDRRAGQAQVAGTAMSLESYAFALNAGFYLHARNRIRITKVREAEAAVAVLRCAFDARYLRTELANAELAKRPLTLELDWPQTALIVEQLRLSDAFDYEVNPS